MRTLLLLSLMMLSFNSNSDDLSVDAAVADRIKRLIERSEARAVVVGLYDNNVTSVTGFGRISDDQDALPDGDTVFEIGSITKVFTALLTQTQVDAARLDWDDAIGQRLDKLEFADETVSNITLRELATHTSGLPRLPDNLKPSDTLDPYAGYGLAELYSFLAGYAPEKLIKQYDYSNLGAGLLGEIAAQASDHNYAKAMAEFVLQPLGMTHSSVGIRSDLARHIAVGYSQGADMPNWAGFDALAGAGAVFSTTNDLLQFIRLNLEDNALSGTLKAARFSQFSGETALGWHIRRTDDVNTYWHNGGTGGYASFLGFDPKSGRGVVILSASTAYADITELGFLQMLGESEDIGPNARLDQYPGTYQLSENFLLTVFARDDRLYAQATGQSAFGLTADGEHNFSYAAADIRIEFEPSDNGPATGLTLFQAGQIMPAKRVKDAEGIQQYTPIKLTAQQLVDFVGRYQLAPGVTITIEVREDQTYAQLTGQSAYPVFPYANDQFFYRVVDAQLHFERSAQGDVSAVVLHQNGQRRAPRIP